MNLVIDLDDAANAIERRRTIWAGAGFEVGPLTWRDIGSGWPYPFVAKDEAIDPDSVGVHCVRGPVEFEIVLFGGHHHASSGSWADVTGGDVSTETSELGAPDLANLAAFEKLLDETFERWSRATGSDR